MNLHFVFPADPLNPKLIDEYFLPQADVLARNHLTNGYSLFSVEEQKVGWPIPAGSTVVYRGWMLNPQEYMLLTRLVMMKGGEMLTSPSQYLATHHLPNWYPLLEGLTAETMVFPNEQLNSGLEFLLELNKQLTERNWSRFFVKDYVKSLKTGKGSVVANLTELKECIDQMIHFRGEIEGGLCVRKYIPGLHDEQRYFVYGGKHWWSDYRDGDIDLLKTVQTRLAYAPNPSPFYSVDIAYDGDGRAVVVEIGDGQVSDLVGWTPKQFGRLFK